MSHSDTDRQMSPSEATLLRVDAKRRPAGRIPAAEGENVVTVAAVEALERLRNDDRVACVVSGRDPGTDPTAFLQAVRVQAPSLPVFFVTDDREDAVAERAYRVGVTDCVAADRCESDPERLLDILEGAAGSHRRAEPLRTTIPSREAVIESLPDGVGIVRDGVFAAKNRQLRDLAEVGNRTFEDIEPRDIVDRKLLDRVQEGGSIERRVGVPLVETSGPTVLADVTVMPTEWNEQPATLVVCRDRSQGSQPPEAGERLGQAVEAAGHAVYTTEPDGTIQYVNAAFEEITGYTAQEVLGKTPRVFASGLMSDAYYQDLWETITAGGTWQEVVANRRKNGDVYYADQTIAPITVGEEIAGFVAIQSDVTKKKEIEDDLRAFKSIVERIEDPIMIQDAAGNYQVVNDAVSDLTGLSRGELIGNDEFAFMDEASARKVQEMKARALKRGEPVSYELTPTLPSNGERTFSTVRYPEYDSDGEPVGTIAICRDVTEIKKHQRQFKVVERVLRHNFRNQIQVIRGVAEAISTDGTGEIEEYAETVIETSDRLLETVEKQRKSTAFLSENTTTQPTDIARVARAVVERLGDEYPEATVTVDAPEQCRVRAVGAIDRAIRELIENAVVHSERSRPPVDVTIERSDAQVRVEIADDGQGIPEIERDTLAGRAEIGPLQHGRGLGLWIVHLIVQESDGTLGFAENEPRGSVVTISLPRLHLK